ncbi:MAG: BTAD domain-containing putative transcriptional regulator [Gammaproteobacteria bacterium]|nr:BTAD domain-containing putative transcriptional regulator [Gammaproteobacteria bacterium]
MKENSILVFDNIQDAGSDSNLISVLKYICEEVPATIKIIFISRTQCPDNLLRLLLNKKLVELKPADIDITQSECLKLCHLILGDQFNIEEDKIDEILNQTNGWITGILMILKDLQTGHLKLQNFQDTLNLSFKPGQLNLLFKYFANELFDRLDADSQLCLAKVVQLPIISQQYMNNATFPSNLENVIERLEKENFFISRKYTSQPSYELHPLFLKFVKEKSETLLNASEINDILRSTAEIALEVDDYEIAATLFIRLKAWDDFKRIILKNAKKMDYQGRQNILHQWISCLPKSIVEKNAELLYWKGLSILYFDPFSAYDILTNSYDLFFAQSDAKWCYRVWFAISTSIYFKHDDNSHALYWFEKLEELEASLKGEPDKKLAPYITVEAFNHLLFSAPDSPKFEQYLLATEKLLTTQNLPDLCCIVGSRLSVYYTFFGKFDKLLVTANRTKIFSESNEVRPLIRILALWTEITASWISGDQKETNQLIEKALYLGREYGVHITESWVLSSAIHSCLIFKKLKQAQEYLDLYIRNGDVRQRIFQSHYYYLLSWLEMEKGNYRVAHEHINYAVDMVRQLNTPLHELLLTVTLAKSLLLLSDYVSAHEQLSKAEQIAIKLKNNHYLTYVFPMLKAWLAVRQLDYTAAKEELTTCFKYGRENKIISSSGWLYVMLNELAIFALENEIELEYTKNLIRLYSLTPDNGNLVPNNWPYPISINTMRDFTVLVDNESLIQKRKSSKKVFYLLKAIIAFGGQEISNDRLAHAVWPDLEGDAAINTLTTTLHRLRKLLGADTIIVHNGCVTLNKQLVWVDVWHILKLLSQIKNRDINSNSIEMMSGALKIYQQAFLKDDEDLPWTNSLRYQIQYKLIHAALKIGDYYEKQQLFDNAKELYYELLNREDSSEEIYQGIMRCSLQQKQASEGMQAYNQCRKILNNKLRVTPSKTTEILRTKLQALNNKSIV